MIASRNLRWAVLLAVATTPVLFAWDESELNRYDETTFQAMAEDYVITRDGSEQPLALHSRSLLNWANPVRSQERGAVFVWTRDDRPQVIGSMFTYVHGGRPHLKHELQSLADGPLAAKYNGQLAWTPKQPGVVWQHLPNHLPPGPNERARLVQLRQIARQFQVTLESPKGEKSELRLLAQPIFRYASKSAGVLDGAIFSFAVATDPEALFLVEAAGQPGAETFRYAFTRFHFWKLTAVDRAGKTVWSAEVDKSHVVNRIGNLATIEKTYNSFQPDPNFGR